MSLTYPEEIWRRSEGKYVFLPRMNRDRNWVEGEAREIWNARYTTLAEEDQYFTPLKYTSTKRRRGFLGKPGVIFADLDGGHVGWGAMPPTLLIESSPGHAHGYWFLESPADPLEWEQHAKGWTRQIGADPGGWDATQVLRVPGTYNAKPNRPRTLVRTLEYNNRAQYKLTDFPKSDVTYARYIKDSVHPTPDRAKRVSYLKRSFEVGSLPRSLLYYLTMDQDQFAASGIVDRSAFMWKFYFDMFEAGFTVEEIYHMVYYTPWNKHNWARKLWHEINKAAEQKERQ